MITNNTATENTEITNNTNVDNNTSLDNIKNVVLRQNKKGYRFSIDAVLIAEFVNQSIIPKQIADIGCGCGIIGILLAKKFEKAEVSLIEIQETLFNLTVENIKINGLNSRTHAYNTDIAQIKETFKPNSFDLIVSNPPYRKPNTGKISPYNEKSIARHELSLSLKTLTENAFYLLRGKGRLCFIHHPSRFLDVLDALRTAKLEPKRVQFIHSDIKTPARMFLIEAVKEGKPDFTLEPPLFLYEEQGKYTNDVLNMLKP
ncbi:methyltransferase small [Candidatus Magnetoovum chiemensis]|nr:methyltransferase small [Candidatus Magnetoovum chiemensis]